MSQFNQSNYPPATPVALDYMLFGRNSDDHVLSASMQALANLFASLASLNLAVSVVSSSTVLTTQQLLEVNSGGATNQTLPASALNTGRRFLIFNKGAGAVTILPNGSDTIAGNASLVLNQYESVTLASDGLGMWATFGAP
jgi:hypothetical protein